MNKRSKFALGTGLAVSLISTTAIAANPFQADKMTTGYNTHAPASITKISNGGGQCGAGRCGANKLNGNTNSKTIQAKCGAGKCGDTKKNGINISPNGKNKKDCDEKASENAAAEADGAAPPMDEAATQNSTSKPKDSAGKCGAGRCGN